MKMLRFLVLGLPFAISGCASSIHDLSSTRIEGAQFSHYLGREYKALSDYERIDGRDREASKPWKSEAQSET